MLFTMDLCVDDPSKTFWDDPKMYVDDPGLDTLLSLTIDPLLPCCNNDPDASVAAHDGDDNKPIKSPRVEQKHRANGKQVLACTYPDCNKLYLKPSHLKVHMRRHSGEKPYCCMWPGCAWRFSRSDELSRHCRSHSGIKPYGCDVCDKRFSRSDHLTKHARVHIRRLAAGLQWLPRQHQTYLRAIVPSAVAVHTTNDIRCPLKQEQQ